MKYFSKSSLMAILITLMLMISAIGVTPALADDETPPPPATEEGADPATSEAAQWPVEEPVVAPEPAATEEVAAPVAEALEQLPADTSLVVVDAGGEALPLATEAAAEVMTEADPKWCPEGALPNDPACSSNFASISALLASMQANVGGFYSQNGVIYFERSALTTFTDPFILDDSAGSLGASYDTLKTFNITLRGGWNGGTTKTFSGSSAFKDTDAYIQVGAAVNPWVGDVTIKNFQIGSNNSTAPNVPVGVNTNNSLTVYTSTGDITLENVDIQRQEGDYYTGYLQSQSGNITINTNSTFDGNNASGQLNKGFSATTDSGSISITSTTFTNASGGNATNYNGATLSAPVVTLTKVTATGNDGSGVYVTGAGLSLVNVYGGTFNNNGKGTYGSGSGLFVNGTGSTIVNLDGALVSGVMTGGKFNNNGRYGVEVTNGVLNELFAPASCTGNPSGCYNVTPNSKPTVALNDSTIEANTIGGWKLALSAIGVASDVDPEDSALSMSCTPAIGTLLAPGSTTNVSCTVTDRGGLTATASAIVSVVDTTAPSLSLPSTITLEATGNTGAAATFSASATDIAYGAVSVSCTAASGSTFPLGTTTVSCSATDGSGNTAKSSFNVTVQDTTAPFLSLPSDFTVETKTQSSKAVTYSTSAFDIASGALSVICDPPSGSIFPEGLTKVTCSATDGMGHTTSGSFLVTVKDHKETKELLYNIVSQGQDQLPGLLGSGNTFGSAFKVELKDQEKQDSNFVATLSFSIPKSMKGAKLAVMFWNGAAWKILPGGSVVGDFYIITVSHPGTYVLVSQ